MNSAKKEGFLARHGAALIDAGYDIVPIKRGEKFPPFDGWEKTRADKTLLDDWLDQGVHYRTKDGEERTVKVANGGVGILAAHTPGVDLDIRDEAIALELENWIHDNVGVAPVRVGQAPKRLLMFRTNEPFSKQASRIYVDEKGRKQQVEILGDGQQFVAFAIHPDTQAPYKWLYRDGPMVTDHEDLPELTPEDAVAIIDQFEQMAADAGWTVKERPSSKRDNEGERSRALVPSRRDVFLEDSNKTDIDDDDLYAALMDVPAQADYDSWLHVGMALYHQYDGGKQGLKLWREWSELAYPDAYDPDEIDQKWKRGKLRIEGKGRAPITARLIIKLAEQARSHERHERTDKLLKRIKAIETRGDIDDAMRSIRKAQISDPLELNALHAAMKDRTVAIIGGKLSLPEFRKLVSAKRTKSDPAKGDDDDGLHDDFDDGFPHVGENGTPLSTVENLQHLLDIYDIRVSYDVMRKKPMILVPNSVSVLDEIDNSAITDLESLASKHRMPYAKVYDMARRIAAENPFNPVADWITSEPWDGKSRLKALYNTIRVADGYPVHMRDMLMHRWLLSCVAAVFTPHGFASHGVLVLTGGQGAGKSAWLKRLVKPELEMVLEGASLEPDNKDSVIVAIEHWLVELGELDGTFDKTHIARLKAFITKSHDKVRRPYAKAVSEYQRRTVFFGSVNQTTYLVDDTGNRRWWTVDIEAIDYAHKIDMQQVWAELYEELQCGDQWWLTREEQTALNELNEAHTPKDPIEEKVLKRFDWTAKKGFVKMTATEVLESIGYDKPNKSQMTKIGSVLVKLTGKRPHRTMTARFHEMPPLLFSHDDDDVWDDDL